VISKGTMATFAAPRKIPKRMQNNMGGCDAFTSFLLRLMNKYMPKAIDKNHIKAARKYINAFPAIGISMKISGGVSATMSEVPEPYLGEAQEE